MGTMILKTLLCILIPVLMLVGLLEKNSRQIAFGLAIGCCMCLAAYYLNNFIYTSLDCSYFYLTTTVAPIVEEVLKFIPILIFSLLVSGEKKSIIPFAFSIGIGFAIIENSYMLLQNSLTSTVGWMILRGIGSGLIHGMSTVMVGFGIYLARKDKRLVLIGTLSSLFLAIMYHGSYNCLIQIEKIQFLGILLPVFTYAAIFLTYKREPDDKKSLFRRNPFPH